MTVHTFGSEKHVINYGHTCINQAYQNGDVREFTYSDSHSTLRLSADEHFTEYSHYPALEFNSHFDSHPFSLLVKEEIRLNRKIIVEDWLVMKSNKRGSYVDIKNIIDCYTRDLDEREISLNAKQIKIYIKTLAYDSPVYILGGKHGEKWLDTYFSVKGRALGNYGFYQNFKLGPKSFRSGNQRDYDQIVLTEALLDRLKVEQVSETGKTLESLFLFIPRWQFKIKRIDINY